MLRLTSWLSLLLVSAGLLSGCSEPVEDQKTPVRPVKLFTVKESGGEDIRQFPAKVYASEEAEISFRIPGELVKFPVKQADEVEKGQLLAQLDDRDIRSELAVKQADYDLAETDFRRISSLRKKKMVSQSDYDNASARLKSAKAALKLAKDKLEDSVLHAPFSGRVAQTLVENYQFVQAQQAILILQGSNTLDISIQVPENILSRIREDDVDHEYKPLVSFSAQPGKQYEATYKEHATRVTPGTQSYQSVFTMPIPEDLTVYPGMGATMTIDLSRVIKSSHQGQQFLVPVKAVLVDDASGENQVWVFDAASGEVHPMTVTLGRVTQSGIYVLSGLKAGDQIVAAGLNRLRPGMEVKPLTRERGL